MLIIPNTQLPEIDNQACAFLDRDGLININHGYVYQRQNFQLMPKVIDGLLALQNAGYLLVVVTNQSGIARGYYSEQEFVEFSQWLLAYFATHGVYFSAIAYCPHHPTAGKAAYLQQCDCRKPHAGMFKQITEKFAVDIEASAMFGDKFIDVQAALNANIPRQFLVSKEESECRQAQEIHSCQIYKNFYSAVHACLAE